MNQCANKSGKNDGPDELQAAVAWQAANGGTPCGDYFSMDYYLDEGEAEYYRDYYAALGPSLLPGQGFFMVPGLFWFMDRTASDLAAYEPSLVEKLWKQCR